MLARKLVLLVLLISGGCQTRPASAPAVSITAPMTAIYTNASVDFRAAVSGGSPAMIDFILADETILGSAPTPYHWTWDTTTEAEGSYQVSARATVSGQTVTSDPITVVVDRTRPSVVRQTPAPGADSVAISDPISLSFSEPLAPASVHSNTAVSVTGRGEALAATSTLAPDGKTISVVLSVPSTLALPAPIVATPSAAITDLAGNALKPPASPWTWTMPAWVALGSAVIGRGPSLALDASDRPYVATWDSAGLSTSAYHLHLAHLSADNTWTELPSPATATVDFAPPNSGSAIVVASDGSLFAAWSQGHVYLARWLGSLWDTSYGIVDDVPGAGGRFPSLALDETDVPTVAWALDTGHIDLAFAARWNPSIVTWQPLFSGGTSPVPIAPGLPTLRLDESGGAGAAYVLTFNTASGTVNWAPGVAGNAWQQLATTTATTVAPDAIVTDLRIDSHGRPFVTVAAPDESAIYVDYLDGSSAWQPLGPSIVTGTGVADVHLILDSADRPSVLWSEGGRDLHVARYTASHAWDYSYGSIQPVSSDAAAVSSPTIALDKNNHIVAAWSESGADPADFQSFVQRSNR